MSNKYEKLAIIQKNPSFNLYREVSEIFDNFPNKMSFNSFIYSKVKSNGEYIVLGTNEFSRHFFMQEYDAPGLIGNFFNPGIYVDQLITMLGYSETIYLDLLAHQLYTPTIVLKKYNDYFETFNFMTALPVANSFEYILQHHETINAFIDYFSTQATTIIATAEQSPIPLLEKHKKSFSYIYGDDYQHFLLQLHLQFGDFSPREQKCAMLLSNGISNRQIAESLNISVRTVEQYVDSLKRKLFCKSKFELTARLARLHC